MLSIVPGTAIAQESVWTDMAPATVPPARQAHGMAYDGESDRIVLFGGAARFDMGPKDDTWAYDFNTNTWWDMNPGVRPSPRWAHVMAYDSESDRVILFGGTTGPETWAYDYNENAWTNMSPVVQPAAWYHGDMDYDAGSDRVVHFGGCAAHSYDSCTADVERGETWVYDFNANTWTNMSPDTSPSRRVVHRMAYDAESDRIVLFGGGFRVPVGDTWAYDLNANSWTRMEPPSAPPRRNVHSMAYDASADRIILFGGWLGTSYAGETWTYDFDDDTWTFMGGMGPSPRGVSRLAYDIESDRMVLFGGSISEVGNDETWAHQLVPSPPPPPDLLLYIAIGVVAAALVAVVTIYLTRRRMRVQEGEERE